MIRRRNRRARNQRGAVSVELAVGIPLLVMVILGGVHFGLVLTTRHQLGDATNFATRRAAIARNANPNQIRSAIQDRLGADTRCSGLDVTSSTSTDALGVRRVDVTARCTATTGIGGSLLPFLGSSEISVRASMPY
ncbi:MAG: TadE/TadG family type IV pilus assembly protein [Kofleriaceae bacterium]|nr:TadE/TadG family type IV pilus assembly protein [Kofleriaceae bacterium]